MPSIPPDAIDKGRLFSSYLSRRLGARPELHEELARGLDTPFDPDLLDKLDPKLVETLCERGFQVTDYRLEIVGHFQEDN